MVDKIRKMTEVELRDKINEYMGRLLFVVDAGQALLHDLVDTYYKNFNPPPTTMKGFIGEDPVFNYVLNHKIPDGLKRNAILFKNLAIALVQAELTDSDIREYAHRIVANCPGKHINEFMGWIKTIKRNPKEWRYNYAEMNKWIEEVNVYEG